MQQYTESELAGFLREVDRHLHAPCEIVVIGGAVLSLAYGSKYVTRDIDILVAGTDFFEAVALAQDTSTSPVPIQATNVADIPWNYEDRLELLPVDGLAKLRVLRPEKHDLALMKAGRGSRHDFDGLIAAHAADPLDLDTLVSRWPEMRHVVGDLRRIRHNVIVLISLLFGEDSAEEADDMLKRFHKTESGM